MAGAGYKLFNTGDVLTAAQVNTYLQEQVVMVFADATARSTALSGVLAEGMVTYLKSDDTVYVYNGSAWVSVANTGDITSVTAGTGLSGGGTSGAVTLDLVTPVAATNGGTAQTTYTTGDLLYASATNTLAKRAIGTTGQVLTVSGGVPTWANAAGGGKVLQVVSATYSTQASTTSGTYQDTGLTASITPSAATSKILVLVTNALLHDRAPATGQLLMKANIVRGATQVFEHNQIGDGDANSFWVSTVTFNYLDSPSTTSSTTYKMQYARVTAAGTVYAQYNNSNASIVLLEIGA